MLATSDLGAALVRRARRSTALDVLAVRARLERAAAAAAAVRRTDADIAAIEAAVVVRRAAYESSDRDAFVSADLAFHQAVVAATGNGVLIDLYAGLTEALRQSVAAVDELDEPAALPGHEELAAAIVARDPDAARAAVSSYLADPVF